MINLLPKEYVQAQKKAKSKRVAMIILIIEVICFIYKAVIGPKLEFRATEIKLERLTTCLNADRYIEINNQIRELEDERIEVQQWDEKYNRLSRKSLVSKQTLDCLLARVPTGLWINVLSISNAQNEVGEEEPQISIEGIAEEEIQLINYGSSPKCVLASLIIRLVKTHYCILDKYDTHSSVYFLRNNFYVEVL